MFPTSWDHFWVPLSSLFCVRSYALWDIFDARIKEALLHKCGV